MTARITFLPSGLTVTAQVGDSILQAALEQDVPIQHACGGNCACTTCQVEVVSGGESLSAIDEGEEDMLAYVSDGTDKFRLACQARLVRDGDVVVTVLNPE